MNFFGDLFNFSTLMVTLNFYYFERQLKTYLLISRN